MNYQGAVPQMMQQPSVQPTPQAPIMQQTIFGPQGSLASRPYPGSGTNVTSGFSGSSSVPMGMGGVQTQGQQSYSGQSQQQQQVQQQQRQSGPGFAGQQWTQSTSGPAQQNYVCSHGATASSTFSVSSTGVTPTHSTGATSTQAATQGSAVKSESKRPLNPPPYSPQILDNLDKFSVGTLTVIGRELVSELTSRTHSLCMSLKAVSERKPPVAGDPEQLLEYCQMLMDKLVEIRLRIERKVGKKRLNTAEYIKMMSDMSPPVEDIPVDLLEKRQQFEENRTKLCTLNNDLKLLDWMASVTDPSLLKKVDKMASTIRERE